MDIADVVDLHASLAGDRYGFLYSGGFPDDHSARLVTLGEAFLNGPANSKVSRSRLAFLMVEAYQNIIRHRAPESDPTSEMGRSMFLLRCRGDAQHVVAANAMSTAGIGALEELLRRLEKMDGMQLKGLFLAGLQDQSPGRRRGAGLGLIEMARRSGYVLQHRLRELGEGRALFVLHARSGRAEDQDPDALEKGLRAQAMVKGNEILLVQHGDAPAAAQEVFLRIIGTELMPGEKDPVTRGYLAAMEFLGGTGSRGRDPQIILSGRSGARMLSIALTLPSDEAERIHEQLKGIGRMDRGDLHREYSGGLLQRTKGVASGELGLLDLARHGRRPLVHQVVPGREQEQALVVQAAL